MSRQYPPLPTPAALPPDEMPPGDANRWGDYLAGALSQINILGVWLPTTGALHLHATIPGFEGLVYGGPLTDRFLAGMIGALETWLEFRLANRLPIPVIPGVGVPTLEDFEEHDTLRASDRGQYYLAHDPAPPRPMEDVFADIEAGR